MDMKSVTMKSFGALAFSVGLVYQINYIAAKFAGYAICVDEGKSLSGACSNAVSSMLRSDFAFSMWPAILLMAAGLVLLAYDFSDCCQPSKAKK